MIVDTLKNSNKYESVHPLFGEAFEFLRSADLLSFEVGVRQNFGNFTGLAFDTEPRGREGAQLERHERGIDIQFPIEGEDLIGWKDAAFLEEPVAPYDEVKDVRKYHDTPALWLPLPAGTFAIFFPGDGHAPLGGTEHLRKFNLKIPVQP